MSANLHRVNHETRTVWVLHDGADDALAFNLDASSVTYVPSVFPGRVGIPYRKSLSEYSLERFAASAVRVVDGLTSYKKMSESELRDFASALVTVQLYQAQEAESAHSSIQGRDLDRWVRGVRAEGGAV